MSRGQVLEVPPHQLGESQQAAVGVPGGPRPVGQVIAVGPRRGPDGIGLHEHVLRGLGDEAEDCHQRPGQHARLHARQSIDRGDPSLEAALQAAASVQVVVQSMREVAHALRLSAARRAAPSSRTRTACCGGNAAHATARAALGGWPSSASRGTCRAARLLQNAGASSHCSRAPIRDTWDRGSLRGMPQELATQRSAPASPDGVGWDCLARTPWPALTTSREGTNLPGCMTTSKTLD